MDAELMQRLSMITPEEQEILQGKPLDKSLYSSGSHFQVDYAKMLELHKLIRLRLNTRFTAFPRHSHNYIEMQYVCSGTVTHVMDRGEKVCLQEGDLLMMNQQAEHAVEKAEHGDIAVNFMILPQYLDVAFEIAGTDNLLWKFLSGSLWRDGQAIRYLHYCVKDVLTVQNLMENLIWTMMNEPKNEKLLTQTTMGVLFLELLNQSENLKPEIQASHQYPLVAETMREIERNYRTASLSDIAARYRVSVAYCSRLIHQVTGMSFKELLLRRRLEKAAQFLKQTDLPVVRIIEAVGYDNTSYFHRAFRQNFGMSPREYRYMGREKTTSDIAENGKRRAPHP